MGKLIYSMNVSLDGYIETTDHRLDWTIIDDEIHEWWNGQLRQRDASLYGRRIYEVMAGYWPTGESDPSSTEPMREFARIWNALPKIVFSRTLARVDWNSRLMSGDVEDALSRLRGEFSGDLDVSGPTLAAQFVERGLVDEYGLVVHPVVLGSGTPFFPDVERPVGLRLVETHGFGSGAVYLRYAAR
jgi:dihydrofolate reductase